VTPALAAGVTTTLWTLFCMVRVIEEWEERPLLSEMGAIIVRGPAEDTWAPGYYSVLFEDPDGIRLEVNFVPSAGLLGGERSFGPAHGIWAEVRGETAAELLAVSSYSGPPMTLGNVTSARVRLIVWCKACQNQVEPDPTQQAELYGAETPVLDWRDRLLFQMRRARHRHGRYGNPASLRCRGMRNQSG
jgi:hypothetical protein